jgi:hypothetical protein
MTTLRRINANCCAAFRRRHVFMLFFVWSTQNLSQVWMWWKSICDSTIDWNQNAFRSWSRCSQVSWSWTRDRLCCSNFVLFKWLCSSIMWTAFASAKRRRWADLLHRVESIWIFLLTSNDEDWSRLTKCALLRSSICFSQSLMWLEQFWMCKKQMTSCKRCERWLCDHRLFLASACRRLQMRNSSIICSHRVLCWRKSKFVRHSHDDKSDESRCWTNCTTLTRMRFVRIFEWLTRQIVVQLNRSKVISWYSLCYFWCCIAVWLTFVVYS